MNVRIADGLQELDTIKSKDFLTEVSEVVFSICKNDSLFEDQTTDIKQIDQMLKELKSKIIKQNTLIEKVMRLVDTGIPDVHSSTINRVKENLANKVITRVSPLFEEVGISRNEDLTSMKKELRNKRIDVIAKKRELEGLQESYKKNKSMKQLLNKLAVLVNSGLLYDPSLRNQTVIMLKVMDKMTNDKLLDHVSEMSVLIKKRF